MRGFTRGGTAGLTLALLHACVPTEPLTDYSRGGSSAANGEAPNFDSLGGTSSGGAGATSSLSPGGNAGLNSGGSGGGSGGVSPNRDAGVETSVSGDASPEAGADTPPLDCNGGLLGPDGETCYFMALSAQSWPDARQSCWDAGQTLLHIDSADEDSFVAGLSQANLWIGASDLLIDGSFVWTDSSAIAFSNWGPAQPDDYPGPDCVEKRQETNEPWYDQPCVDTKLYICEAPAQ